MTSQNVEQLHAREYSTTSGHRIWYKKQGHMWPDLWKGTLTRFSKCVYFKEAYFRNAIGNLNQTLVFYGGGVAAAMTRKWSLSTAPSGCYEAEFMAFAIEASFSKNGTTTKVRIFGMEGALDF